VCEHSTAIARGVISPVEAGILAEAPELARFVIPLAEKFAEVAAADYRRRYC
jgi:formaldehyde-activating enzyme involved in methanogenesis